MLERQGIEFRILKLKLHSCTAYRVVGAGIGGRHGYRLSYAFQGIGLNRRGTSFLGPSWELWRHRCQSTVATQDRVFPHYVPNSSIKHSKSDSKDRSQEIL
jgi:hypothetical protein